jgi:hypothetical protein
LDISIFEENTLIQLCIEKLIKSNLRLIHQATNATIISLGSLQMA